MPLARRPLVHSLVLILALAAGSLGVPSMTRAADLPAVTSSDRILGRTHARVTVIEYASFTCSHCGDWHRDVYPAFKARFIDTGRVRLVFRDMPTAPQREATAAAMIGRCAAPGHFFTVADAFFDGQAALTGDGQTWFAKAIAVSGQSREQIAACFARPATQATLMADVQAGADAGVEGTPTFFVNGRMIADHTLEGLTAAIDAARARH